MNGKLVQTFSTFTPNNAWGQITRSLVAGFDAGMWGGSAKSLNPDVSGRIDLNQTWNWSAPYTYQAITAPSGTNKFGYKNSIGMGTGTVGDPNRKMYYDPFAAVFVKYSNAYGYSYSDLLSEGGGVNPSLSIFDPGTNSDVSKIDVKLFDLGETPTGYTAPSFAYVPPTGSTYKAADTLSTDQFLFDFSLGSYFPVSGVPMTFSFYAPGDSQAKNDFVSFKLPTGTTQGKDYQQSFTVTGKPGKWTLQANGYSGSPGFLMVTGVPVTKDGSTGWYQMTIGSGSLAKTYNMYVQSSSSAPTSHISSAVVDGGALAQLIPQPGQPGQVQLRSVGQHHLQPVLLFGLERAGRRRRGGQAGERRGRRPPGGRCRQRRVRGRRRRGPGDRSGRRRHRHGLCEGRLYPGGRPVDRGPARRCRDDRSGLERQRRREQDRRRRRGRYARGRRAARQALWATGATTG